MYSSVGFAVWRWRRALVEGLVTAATAGVAGALVGTFVGYNIRRALVMRAHLPDFAVAVAEDFVAIVGGLLIVSRL